MVKRDILKRKPHFGGAIGGSMICCCWGFWSEEEEGCVVVFCVTLTAGCYYSDWSICKIYEYDMRWIGIWNEINLIFFVIRHGTNGMLPIHQDCPTCHFHFSL